MNIALLALLGVVSATDLTRHHRKTYQTARLDDQGFIVLGQQVYAKKESDWLANGDDKDDLEVLNEFDPEDPVVMDNGFGLASGNWAENAWTANQYKGSLRDLVQLDAHTNHKSKVHAKKESDWISNADAQDDKECESELGDGSDEIVTDNGFALSSGNWADNKWTRNHYDPDLMFLMQQHHEHKAKKHHHHHPGKHTNVQLKKESDWIANADAADDKEVESEMGDAEDEVVMDSGFGLSSGIWEPNQYAFHYKPELNFLQLDSEDHFYTEDFKENHPNKVKNAFYQRGEQEDIVNMMLEYNEIDNYNPRAQARLARYI